MQDESILSEAISRLESTPCTNESQITKKNTNIEAIETFSNSYDSIQLNSLTPSLGSKNPPTMLISGVEVSIFPDIELSGVLRNKRKLRGALKLYFSKKDPLTENGAHYGAVLVLRHCQNNLAAGTTVRPAYCSVFDVFAGAWYAAPPQQLPAGSHLEINCHEIAVIWPTVTL